MSDKQIEKLKAFLDQKGFEFSTMDHGLFRAKSKGVVVQAYKTGKVLVQGKEALEFSRNVIEPEILQQATIGYEFLVHPEYFEAHVGIDECGKGDLFGPLVIAAVFVEPQTAKDFLEMGIKDSKRISSIKRLNQFALEIKKRTKYALLTLPPLRYNELYEKKFKNLNLLLAWAHAWVYKKLSLELNDSPKVLCDRFAQPWVLQQSFKRIGADQLLEQKTKAESDPAVAAASILARLTFVEELAKLSQVIGLPLPKGASSKAAQLAKDILLRCGKDTLQKVAKIHFKTIQQILANCAL
ncbi:hypothetical protein A946_01630 [Methylacidiphilum kamchatkense Kam1]|uniref:Ribonuclease n=1 Tax=Methylacidiphilum kamchatkense Kam1 TaxID=1202785 RepID=A0ABR4ZZ75_9BACT|nr:hypothetical protein A946_01630 [Methylacidiphilum kamchatkense Kam1]